MRGLVVAPHADDETLGCGGVLAKHPTELSVVLVSLPAPDRAAEHQHALIELGGVRSHCLGFPDSFLDEHTRELVSALDDVFAQHLPDVVYLPSPALHQDHVAVYEAGLRACRLSMHREHWFVPRVLIYDVAAYDMDLYLTGLQWNVFESLTEEQVSSKERACLAYRSENPGGPHPITLSRAQAQAVGAPRRLGYAERFSLVRDVVV